MRELHTVSNHKILPFDLLNGQAEPFAGFGAILLGGPQQVELFRKCVNTAKQRVRDTFGVTCDNVRTVPSELDGIFKQMWAQGWSGTSSSLNLFVTDLGCILTDSLLGFPGARLVFRSENDISHLSVWWEESHIEAFPFHLVLKCLTENGTTSAGAFARGVASLVGDRSQSTPDPQA